MGRRNMYRDGEGTFMTTPPADGYPPYPGPGAQPGARAKGFFGALFDFSFEHFITPMIVKAVYVIAFIVLTLLWLFVSVATLARDGGVGIVILILGAVVALLYLAFVRMTLEFYLAIVRMSQDIHQRLPR